MAHLNGGIPEDRKWQRLWKRVVSISPSYYCVPQGAIGRRFLATLVLEFRGIRDRRWNSERTMIFAAVILQKAKGVTKAKDIRARLKSRLDLWDQGGPIALIDDLEAED